MPHIDEYHHTSRTSGLTSAPKRKPKYDPDRQWGLKPSHESSTLDASSGIGATYVVSGHIVSGSGPGGSNGSGSGNGLFVGETLGREAQARAARRAGRRGEEGEEEVVRALLARDKVGTKAVVAAREFVSAKGDVEEKGRVKGKGKGKGKEKLKAADGEDGDEDEDGDTRHHTTQPQPRRKDAYTASMIKHLGFDPTARDRDRDKKGTTNSDKRNKVRFLYFLSF